MRRKMYATAMTAMLVTGTLMGLAVPAAERDGVTLHGDSTYDSIEKITDEDLTLKIMLAIRDGDTIKAPEELAAVQLTLKVFCHEGINIAQTLAVEAAEGADAVVDYQLKH